VTIENKPPVKPGRHARRALVIRSAIFIPFSLSYRATERINNADTSRPEDHNKERREQKACEWQEQLDRGLLRGLLRALTALRAQLVEY
jgi:hypothetical protein